MFFYFYTSGESLGGLSIFLDPRITLPGLQYPKNGLVCSQTYQGQYTSLVYAPSFYEPEITYTVRSALQITHNFVEKIVISLVFLIFIFWEPLLKRAFCFILCFTFLNSKQRILRIPWKTLIRVALWQYISPWKRLSLFEIWSFHIRQAPGRGRRGFENRVNIFPYTNLRNCPWVVRDFGWWEGEGQGITACPFSLTSY